MIDRFAFPAVFGAGGPVLWFGASGVVGTLLGLGAAEVFRRTHAAALTSGAPARLLAALGAVDVAAVIVFATGGNLWLTFAMLWVRRIVGTIREPVQTAWLNRNLDPASRATVISMTGQANSIGQAVGGPALGWVGSAVSIQAALLGSALVLAPTVALYRRLIARGPESAPVLAARAALPADGIIPAGK
jgi:DHA3 family tetracycline resistance protein-like MFS transporter